MVATRLEVRTRAPYGDGAFFGDVGHYERVDGRLSFAVDPEDPANAVIVDLVHAPREPDGTVTFHSDVVVLRPADPRRGNGAALVEAVNRGQPLAPRVLDRAPYEGWDDTDVSPGDGFLFRHGYTVVHLGWQWDVRRRAGRLGFDAPEARIDGAPVTGRTVVELRSSFLERTRLLANRDHQPYPAADLEEADALLTVRDWDDGPVTVIPRDRWCFARETASGLEPSAEHVHYVDGFEPGRQYHVVYTAARAPVVGAGLLAFRDVAGFLRSGTDDRVGAPVERVHGFGMSQSGRLLRHFLHLGLNRDERGRMAYDGLIPHVAGGRRGEFNHRFAQPSVQLVPNFGHLPPFADDPQIDPVTGVADGLLERQRERGGTPKVCYVNTSAEYWRGDCSLIHTDPDGTTDLASGPGVRHYHLASTQHFPGEVPQTDYNEHDGGRGRYGFNVVDMTPAVRAVLHNLDRWVADGVEPPPSEVPRLADGTLTTRSEVLSALPALPDLVLPDPARLPVLRAVDLGPDAPRGVGRYPVQEGHTYPCLVAAVDADGNEVAGIRLPDVTVPIGTHVGFNPRHPDTGAPEQIMSMQGSTWWFARTRHEREGRGDPRPSVEERYTGREDYLARVRDAAERLVDRGHLLDEDVAVVCDDAADRWDDLHRGPGAGRVQDLEATGDTGGR